MPVDRRTTEHSSLTPSQRSLRARAAANKRWATTSDRTAGTAAARAAWRARFEDQVDPERLLSETERARRVDSAITAHMQGLAFRRQTA